MDVLHIMFGGFGGQMAVANEVARAFQRYGLRSSACLYAPPGQFAGAEGLSGFADVVSVEKRHKVDLSGARQIGATIRRQRPRSVFWHSAYAPGALLRAKISGSTSSVVLIEHQSLALRGAAYEIRSLTALSIADGVVFLSDDYRAGYRLRRVPAPALRRATVIPNGVDLEAYSPVPVVARGERQAPRPLRIGMAGRMVTSKGFDEVLRAVARLRSDEGVSLDLVLAGDGPDLPRLQALAAALGIGASVRFPGRLGQADLVDCLRSLDLYVHVTRGETGSLAVLQAYAVGLPVLASDVSGVNTLVRHDEDGLLVPNDDMDQLVVALGSLARDPARRLRLGSAARQRAVRDFGSEAMTQSYLRLLSSIDPAGPWRGR